MLCQRQQGSDRCISAWEHATGASTEGPPALAAKHTELHWVAGAVAAADHTRSGAEQHARTTAIAIQPAAQNGTSGVLAGDKYARGRVAMGFGSLRQRRQPLRSTDDSR